MSSFLIILEPPVSNDPSPHNVLATLCRDLRYLEYNKTVVHEVKWWSTKFFHYYRISSPYLMFKHLAFWPTVKIPKGVQTSIHWFNQDCWTINTHNGIMKGIRQGCPLSVCFLGDITTFLFHLSLFITTIT